MTVTPANGKVSINLLIKMTKAKPTEEQLNKIARSVNPLLMMVDKMQLEVIFCPYLNDEQKKKITFNLEQLCINEEAENLRVVMDDEAEAKDL